jgi:TorA maturation chaperone TorD
MMNSNCSTGSLLAQADLLLLFADAFRLPREDQPPRLLAMAIAEVDELLAAARLVDSAAALPLRRACCAASGLSQDQWSDGHYRLFEGAMLCPLNESAYIRRDKGAILGDLCAFYSAFGWQADPASAEKPDHLACELEFVAMLLVMMAAADEQGNDSGRTVTDDALSKFAESHLGDWLPLFCGWLGSCAGDSAHGKLPDALLGLWTALAEVHGWPVAPAEVVQPSLDEEPSDECGTVGRTKVVDLTVGGAAAG